MFTRRQAGAATEADPGTTDDRTQVQERTPRNEPVQADERFARDRPLVAPDTMNEVRAQQRARFGGFSWGSDFFGWLAAAGLAGSSPASWPPPARRWASPRARPIRSGWAAASRS